MSTVDAVRQQWEEGNRRLQSEASDPEHFLRLVEQLAVTTEELRKRIGEVFTLAELAEVYDGSDHWLRAAVEDRLETPDWQRHLSLVQDAAFHLYARGATDYRP